MANFDGDIQLRVDLTPGDIKSTAVEMQESVEKVFDASSMNKKLSTSFKSLLASMDKAYNKSSMLQDKLLQLENSQVETKSYKQLSDELENLLKKSQEFQTKAQAMAKNPNLSHIDVAQFKAEMDSNTQSIQSVRNQMQQLVASGQAFVDLLDTTEGKKAYEKTLNDLKATNDQLTIYAQRARESQEVGPKLQGWRAFILLLQESHPVLAMTTASIIAVGRAALKGATAVLKLAGKGILMGLGQVAKLAGNAAKNLAKMAGQGILSGIKKLGSSMAGLAKHTKSSNSALNAGFKRFLQFGLGIRSVYFLVKKLRAGFIEGLGNLAQYSEPFNQTVSNFITELNMLKNSFAAAFAPIISVVAPIITQFLAMLNDAIAKVGEFLYALTGNASFIKAKRIYTDYAKSLDKSTKSTDKSTKATKKNTKATKENQLTIAGFDDVEILKEDKDKGTDTDTGSSAGADAGDAKLTGKDMFETLPVSKAMSDFANKIRDMIKKQDWTGLGTFLGQSINKIFEKARQLISWDNLGGRITAIVTAITETLNALVSAVDWDLIGSTFATGINTIIYTLNLLLTGIDWYAIGKSLADALDGLIRDLDWAALGTLLANYLNVWIHVIQGFVENFDWVTAGLNFATGLNNFIENIDWENAGTLISTALTGALEFLATAIENFDWFELGQKIQKFLSKIDWSSIASAVFRVIGAALGGLAAFLWGILKKEWEKLRNWLFINAFNTGKFSIEGLFKGIIDALANIGEWVYLHILVPFKRGFEKAFRIGSPSKLMEDEGKFIIEGLKRGLIETWHNISSFFTDKIEAIKKFFTEGGWKTLGEKVTSTLKEGITNNETWQNITSKFSTAVTDIKGYFEDTDWSNVGSNIVSGIQDGITSGWEWLKTSAWNLAVDTYNAACDALDINSPSRVFRDKVGKMIPAGMAEGISDDENLAVKAVTSMAEAVQAGAVQNVQIPAVVKGEIIPYSATSSNNDDVSNTLSKLLSAFEYSQGNQITPDELTEILAEVIQRYMNFDIRIGDEQIARHANRGNAKLDRRFKSGSYSFT